MAGFITQFSQIEHAHASEGMAPLAQLELIDIQRSGCALVGVRFSILISVSLGAMPSLAWACIGTVHCNFN